jgi:hypothetical protein
MPTLGRNPSELPVVAFDTADYVITRNPLASGTQNELSRTLISQFAASIHNHDSRYYTEAEVDALLAGYSVIGHNHDGDYEPLGTLHDDRYYTETEVDGLLTGYSVTGHNHDERYYTESEVDALFAALPGGLDPAADETITGQWEFQDRVDLIVDGTPLRTQQYGAANNTSKIVQLLQNKTTQATLANGMGVRLFASILENDDTGESLGSMEWIRESAGRGQWKLNVFTSAGVENEFIRAGPAALTSGGTGVEFEQDVSVGGTAARTLRVYGTIYGNTIGENSAGAGVTIDGVLLKDGEVDGVDISTEVALKSNVLELDNTSAFTPTADYHPATKKYVDDNGGGGTDADAIHDNVAGEIAAITAKATPTASDYLLIEDAADSNSKKRITLGDLPPPSAQELGARPIYNMVDDGGITADYVDRLTPGTDQRASIIAVMTAALAAGWRRFYFPAGHYLISEGIAGGGGVMTIDGYDDVEIFGIRGQTVFHTAQGMDLKYKNRSLFQFGLSTPSARPVVRDMAFVVEPYVTNSLGSDSDNGIKWGWKYYEPHRTSVSVTKGEYKTSTDDNWLILYTSDGVSAGTEPTWSGATTTDGTASVTVVALNNWQPSTAYTAGDHVKTTKTTGGVHGKGNLHGENGDSRSIMWASNSGTSGATATEPQLALPSNDGTSNTNDDPAFEWIGFSFYASDSYVSGCEFSGMAGFGQAGGTAMGLVEGGGGLVEDCYFHDAQYGGVVTGFYDNWTFRDCKHYKLGGWGFMWGTYNAHGYYCQGARNLWDNCTFDSHFYGLDIKVHPNVPNNDVWQTRIRGCVFSNPGWSSVEWVGPGHVLDDTVTDGPDFIEEATSGSTHSGAMCKQGSVIGCTFRVYKRAWDNFDWRRPGVRPMSGGGVAIRVNTDGINVVGCDFTDMFGIISGSEEPAFGTHNPVNVTGCSFQTIYRAGYPFQGTVWASNCTFDFRALGTLSPPTVCVALEEYSRLVDSSIMAHQTQTGDPDNGVLRISGNHVIVDNVQIELVNTGHPVSFGSGSGTIENVTMTNCQVHAPNGTMYCYPGSGSRYWKFKDNYWNIGGWDYFRFVQAAHETWVWENEKGNFFTCRWDGTYKDNNSGTVRLIPTTARSFNGAGYLINSNAGRVTDVADIYGVELEATDHSAYHSFVAVDEGKNHWIHMDSLVAKGDWLTLSATSGKLEPNGTSGSTTRPTSGIQARVINAGTASAGAGRAQVEVLEWNRSAAGSGLVEEDIDTLAELNAILTDATLIDTGDSRLSDARTPTAHTHAQADITGLVSDLAGKAAVSHTHVAANITDFASAVAATASVTANTAKVSFVTTGANVWSQTQSYGESTLSDAANISWNVQTDPAAKVTLAGNRTLDNPTNMTAGTTYVLRVIQDATGSRTLSYGANYKWPGGTAPTLSTGANAVDILSFYCDGSYMYGVEGLAFA